MTSIEQELVTAFRNAGLKLYHTIPQNASMPFSVYDRLSGELNLYHTFENAKFAIDIFGINLEMILNELSKIKDLINNLMDSDNNFVSISIINLIDNSSDNSFCYTATVAVLFNEN